ncbi:MAG: hypothetical protein JW884_11990 [Deltaproteobacteria bacterium]|nr:hypothetical protein [Deltaproteobacteria bacterium]
MKRFAIIMAFVLLTAALAQAGDSGTQPGGLSPETEEGMQTLTAAGISADEAAAVTKAMNSAGFAVGTTKNIQRALSSASRTGFPSAPFIDKVFEGIAKGVTGEQVLAAVERVHNRFEISLREAKRLSPEKNQVKSYGTIIAESLQAGIIEKDLVSVMDELVEQASKQKRGEMTALATETLQTLRDTARLQVDSFEAAAIVKSALQHSFTSVEMKELRHSILSQARFGDPPSIARQYRDDIKEGRQPGGRGSRGLSGGAPGSPGGPGGGSSGGDSGSGSGGGSSGGNSGSGSGGGNAGGGSGNGSGGGGGGRK